jgi:carboxyl-terminal processing protease
MQYKIHYNLLLFLREQMVKDNKEKRDRWHEGLAKDIYVEEALNVLDDLQAKAVVKKTMTTTIKKGKLAKS